MPTGTRKPSPHESTGSAELDAMVERVAPSILELLADGVPRSKAVIAEALAVRHDKQDVVTCCRSGSRAPVSAKGPRYLSGFMGDTQVLMFDAGEREHPTKPGETVHVWRLMVQE